MANVNTVKEIMTILNDKIYNNTYTILTLVTMLAEIVTLPNT